MNTLLALALSNVAVASVLAAIAYGVGRYCRRPALTHGLWLLVFLKLLTPPLVSIPVIRTAAVPLPPTMAEEPIAALANPAEFAQAPAPAPFAPEIAIEPQPQAKTEPPAQMEAPVPMKQPAVVAVVMAPPLERHGVPIVAPVEVAFAEAAPATSTFNWSWLLASLGWVWLAGAVGWFLLAAVRLLRFHRLLRWGQPASAELQALAEGVAKRMQVTCPRLVLVPGMLSPMLWVFGRVPRLVLPIALVERLTPEQGRTLLAHELAHWRRRDHWVRWLELATLGWYWWCPLVWFAKRELEQAEEECCDAWVVTTLPGAARAYALALVETVDFLSGARTVLPPAASGLGHIHLLRRRVTMILRGRTPRALTLTGALAVLILGVAVLPLMPTWAQDAAPAAQKEDKPADKSDKEDKGDKGEKEKVDPAKAARAELQNVQQEFFKLQQQMEQRRRDFEEKLTKEFTEKQQQLMKRMQEAMQKSGFAGGAGPAGLPIGPMFPNAGVPLRVDPNPLPLVFPPGGFPGAPGGFAPAPGLFNPGAFPPGGQPRPDVDRRIDELERKLDKLLERLGGPGGPPGRGPGASPQPRGKGPNQPPEPDAPPPPPRRGNAAALPPLPGGLPPAGLPRPKAQP